MDASKYRVGYFPVGKQYRKWGEKDRIERPPTRCSVDMRDGTQSLVIPMSLEEKPEYYKLLLEVGFKEIEAAVSAYLDAGYRTADSMSEGMTPVGCKRCGELIVEHFKRR